MLRNKDTPDHSCYCKLRQWGQVVAERAPGAFLKLEACHCSSQ